MKLELKFDNMISDLIFFKKGFINIELQHYFPKEKSYLNKIWSNLIDCYYIENNGNRYFLSISSFQKKPEIKDKIYNETINYYPNLTLIFDLENVNITEENLFYIKLKYC